jgi:hypothetical protein
MYLNGWVNYDHTLDERVLDFSDTGDKTFISVVQYNG